MIYTVTTITLIINGHSAMYLTFLDDMINILEDGYD
jgi:hypothetical protein